MVSIALLAPLLVYTLLSLPVTSLAWHHRCDAADCTPAQHTSPRGRHHPYQRSAWEPDPRPVPW